MGINVWTSMGFENRNFQGSTAQNSAKNDSENEEKSSESLSVKTYSVSESTIENLGSYLFANQITLNKPLKETLKYIQSHANNRRKRYILGELWNSLGDYNDEDDYCSELIDFEPDSSLENIFAA